MDATLFEPLCIDGRLVGIDGESTDVLNPATEETVGRVPVCSVDQAKEAIAAASRAFDDGGGVWPSMSPGERSRLLHRFCDQLEAHLDDLLLLARVEVGSTRALAESLQVPFPLELMRYWADQALTYPFEEPLPPTRSAGKIGQTLVRKEPVGVVAAITPFNFPLMLNISKIGPALALGNTVVLKPSPYTPMSALILGRLALEAGIPPGVLNVITGDASVGELLTTHPEVSMVTFTGSDGVGRQIMQQAAGSLKRVTLELGGKSANTIFADTDLDDPRLIGSILGGFTIHCGQGCSLTTRILVEEPIYDEVVSRAADAVARLRIGDPVDPDVNVGPLIRTAQRDRVEHYVQEGVDAGATLVAGGRRPPDLARGYFFEPTVFADVSNQMSIAQDEIFGPVGVFIRFNGLDEAVRIANDSRYGLGGAVWSADSRKAFDYATRVRTGGVSINGGTGSPRPSTGPAPFGGYKHSGIGREHGKLGAEEFLEAKTMNYPIC